jgi:phage internal scaffolding protein
MSMRSLTGYREPVVRKCFDRTGYPMEEFEKTRTRPEFAAECDINNIVKRYRVTGLMPQITQQPMVGDFSELPTYQEALNTVIRAREGFSALPSDVRERFQNDPERFLEFVHDPENLEELIEMGLAERKPQDPVDRIVDAIASRSEAEPAGEAD